MQSHTAQRGVRQIYYVRSLAVDPDRQQAISSPTLEIRKTGAEAVNHLLPLTTPLRALSLWGTLSVKGGEAVLTGDTSIRRHKRPCLAFCNHEENEFFLNREAMVYVVLACAFVLQLLAFMTLVNQYITLNCFLECKVFTKKMVRFGQRISKSNNIKRKPCRENEKQQSLHFLPVFQSIVWRLKCQKSILYGWL